MLKNDKKCKIVYKLKNKEDKKISNIAPLLRFVDIYVSLTLPCCEGINLLTAVILLTSTTCRLHIMSYIVM